MESYDGETPGEILVRAVVERDFEGIRAVLDAGFCINTPVHKQSPHTALHKAVMIGEAEVVDVLINAGADVNLPMDSKGTTALHWAAKRGDVEISTQLVDAGADIEARNSQGLTPAGVARSRGYRFLGDKLAGEKIAVPTVEGDNVVSFRPRL